jgi:hypothetical protein
MEEEMRQGMMGADVDTSTVSAQPMELKVSARQVSNNLQNLGDQERELITQLNVPQFRDFMSKVFGPEFGMVMQEAIPEPQQPVSQPSESPAPMMGQGMMTQPPSQ